MTNIRSLLAIIIVLGPMTFSGAALGEPLFEFEGLSVKKNPDYQCYRGIGLIIEAKTPDLFFNYARLQAVARMAAAEIRKECPQVNRIGFNGMHKGHELDHFEYGITEDMMYTYSLAAVPIWAGQLGAPGRAMPSGRQLPQGTAVRGSGRAGAAPAPNSREARMRQRQANLQPQLSDRRFFYRTSLVGHWRFGDVQPFANFGGSAFRYTTPSEFLVGKRYTFHPYDESSQSNNLWKTIDSSAPGLGTLEITDQGVVATVGGERQEVPYAGFPSSTGTLRPECFRSSLLPNVRNRLFTNGYCFTVMSGEKDGVTAFFLASYYPTKGRPGWGLAGMGRLVEIQ
ncbi:MAG: hypothetical protein QNJ14_17120 [Woeseiaceae bacterium]|nr:hypothetical protein [Woeseiaceae bacterium]